MKYRPLHLFVIFAMMLAIVAEFELSSARRIDLDNRIAMHHNVIYNLDNIIFAISTSGKIYKSAKGIDSKSVIGALEIQRARVEDSVEQMNMQFHHMPHMRTYQEPVEKANSDFHNLMATYHTEIRNKTYRNVETDAVILDKLKTIRLNSIELVKTKMSVEMMSNISQERTYLYVFLILSIIPILLL